MPAEHVVIGTFTSGDSARLALDALKEAGFTQAVLTNGLRAEENLWPGYGLGGPAGAPGLKAGTGQESAAVIVKALTRGGDINQAIKLIRQHGGRI